MQIALATTGALIVILSGIPYIIDTIKGRTRPNIVSWFTWTLLITIGGFAALDANQPLTAILTFGDATQVFLIFLLGFRYGFAKFSLFDGICQAGAILGLALWLIFNNPVVAIAAGVLIDLIAALPTFRHSWLSPQEETWQTYLISSLGAAVGLLAIRDFTIAGFLYPVYLLLLGVSLATVIVMRRKAKGLALASSKVTTDKP